MKNQTALDRRTFLKGLGATTAGLYIAIYYGPAGATQATNEIVGDKDPKPKTSAPEEEVKAAGLNPNAFLHIAPDGRVTIVCHRSEMGQGIRSSLPVLLADELGADMKNVTIVQADGDKKYGDQNTDGSNSVRGIYDTMRKAAATARYMLVAAAAQTWKVKPQTCTTENGFVIHKPTKRKLAFGSLAIDASKLPLPKPENVTLKKESELRRVGRALPLIDGHAYVTGTAPFGADIKLPNMLIATIARPPVIGSTIGKYDAKAAKKVAGVHSVIEMPQPKEPYIFQPWGGVAVVAENTWAAIKGRSQLNVSWKSSPHSTYDSKTYRETLLASVRKPGNPVRKVGDVEKAFTTAAKTIEAEYYVPHLPHVSMEPPVAIADFKNGKCEVWAPTQNPQAARTEVARVLGTNEDNVTVHVTFLGGAFGRKSKADFVSEAAWLSKQAGRPVRVQFTRDDDLHNDYLNTVNAQKFSAALDPKGKVLAWHHRTAFPPIGSLFNTAAKGPGADDLQQGVLDVPLNIPNVLTETCDAPAHLRIGWLRSVYNIFHAFAVNSFIDEIAHAKGSDPRETMLEILGPPRIHTLKDLGIESLKNYGASLEEHPVDAARLQGVIKRVTKNANWSKRKSRKTHAFGLAAHRSFLSYAAVVASVTKREGQIAVDEVWISIDAGKTINPDRVRSQMEGAILNGMSHLFFGGVTHKNGAVEQNNFDTMPVIRMNEAARKIHVDLVTSSKRPGGVGEPGVPPVAPAIANAIFALTGKRVREFNLREFQT